MPQPHLWIPTDRLRRERIVPTSGGSSFVRTDPGEHSKRLSDAFARSASELSSRRDFDVAAELFVHITTTPGRSISQERQHLRNLGFEIISLVESDPQTAVARIPAAQLPRLNKRLDRYTNSQKHVGKSNFGAIEVIKPIGFASKVSPRLTASAQAVAVPCLISLYGALSSALKETVADRLYSDLHEAGKTDVRVHYFSNGAVGIAAPLTGAEMERVSEQYMLVRTIESNAEMISEAAVAADPVPQIVQVDSPRIRTPVVVVDSGVHEDCSLLRGLVLRVLSDLPAGSVGPHKSHGTFVASRVIYGDDITSVLTRRARPWCPIIDVQVIGRDAIGNRMQPSPSTLGEILQRVVPVLASESRVFNLSLGLSPITDSTFSALARLIDYLSRAHQVLFVVSAGNIDDPTAGPPHHFLDPSSRIRTPGESILALTVGAIANESEQSAVAQRKEVSPFSSRGPGADGARKPELAANGGNAIWNGTGFASSPRTAVYGLDRDGLSLAYGMGTSYSAPLVSQFAARLFDAYADSTPNLVRALLCHFTDRVISPQPGPPIQDHDFCGFGEPAIDRAMFAGAYSAAYLLTGTISADNYLYIPFHIPQAFAGTSGAKLRVRYTVVFDPPVSLDDSVDYSLCRISGRLRKRTDTGLRDVANGSDDDVLHPWNPTLQFQKSFRHSYVAGEWELRLRLMTRGDLPEDFEQSFAAVIEIIDDAGVVDVRDAITREVQTFIAIQLNVAA